MANKMKPYPVINKAAFFKFMATGLFVFTKLHQVSFNKPV